MIDTHCHLTFPDFAGVIGDELALAREHAVSGCITISTTTVDCLETLRIAKQFDNVWCTAGVHPSYSDRTPHQWANLKLVGKDPKCVAWGELGLDNHWPEPTREQQHRILAEQLAFLESLQDEGIVKPVVLHCREAFADLLPILKNSRLDRSRYVFHCFTGTPDEARAVLDFGAWISFTGVVTYKNAKAVREAAALVPADRIMVETDAPFLSPEPHRSKRPCRVWMVSLTARTLAEIRNIAFEEFHSQLNKNTNAFFGIHAT